MTRSKATTLRDAVIEAASDAADAIDAMHMRGDDGCDRLFALIDALDAYHSHLGDIETKRAAFSGRDTSEAAAGGIIPTVGSVRRRALDTIRLYGGGLRGLTCQETEARLKMSHETVSSALNWLIGHGWLEDSGYRRPTRAKRPAIVWTITSAAMARMNSPEWIERKESMA